MDTLKFVAVYYTGDGPFVYGPFDTEAEAKQSILDFYVAEYGITLDEAKDRYDSSGDEWATGLLPPEAS
jgi:hypothetical protein